jgi:thiamine kinase-like enzyme
MKNEVEKLIKENGYKVSIPIEVDSFGRYHGTVIDNEGEELFVKAIKKDGSYGCRSLEREVNVTTYLSEVTKNNKIEANGKRLIVPEVKKVLKNGKVICMLSEYVTKSKLLDQPSGLQAEMLIKTLELVEKINYSTELSTIDKDLKSYDNLSIFFKIPIRSLKAVVLNPKLILKIIKTAFRAAPVLGANTDNVLVHADINASNIFFDEDTIYLMDWEEAGKGMGEYNGVVPLSVHWNDEIIRKSLINMLIGKNDLINSLLAYRVLVLMDQVLNFDDPRRIRDLELLDHVVSN